MAESLLALSEILVRHGDKVVLEVPFLEIRRGEVLALLGPNGAGKTTLLRVMGLLQMPDAGTVRFNGEPAGARNALAIRRRIANVFQEPLLLNTTVYQNAAVGLKLRGWSKPAIGARLNPWLERLGIAHLGARGARTLSGGEAQRTSLARAFAVEPELVLLDEPFSALDPITRESLLWDFQRIVVETGTTTVFVTHNRDEAYGLGDRVAVLKAGRVLQVGARDEVFLRPKSEAAAEIAGFENRIAGTVASSDGGRIKVSCGGHTLLASGDFAAGTAVWACIRAEDVALASSSPSAGSENRLRGKIAEVTSAMNSHRVSLDCGAFRLTARIEGRGRARSEYRTNAELTAAVAAAAVHVVRANPV